MRAAALLSAAAAAAAGSPAGEVLALFGPFPECAGNCSVDAIDLATGEQRPVMPLPGIGHLAQATANGGAGITYAFGCAATADYCDTGAGSSLSVLTINTTAGSVTQSPAMQQGGYVYGAGWSSGRGELIALLGNGSDWVVAAVDPASGTTFRVISKWAQNPTGGQYPLANYGTPCLDDSKGLFYVDLGTMRPVSDTLRAVDLATGEHKKVWPEFQELHRLGHLSYDASTQRLFATQSSLLKRHSLVTVETTAGGAAANKATSVGAAFSQEGWMLDSAQALLPGRRAWVERVTGDVNLLAAVSLDSGELLSQAPFKGRDLGSETLLYALLSAEI